ncbi:MAG: leucine-rich repeat domain-containing protein, partial [Bdellovibrionales bacterium]|nr:leucine-rich repeat domain-containing protein [Bdellovibrionales bacterium]
MAEILEAHRMPQSSKKYIATYTRFSEVHEFPSLPVLVRIADEDIPMFQVLYPMMTKLTLTPDDREYLLTKYGVEESSDIRFFQDRPLLHTVTFREAKLFDVPPNLRAEYKQSEEITQILSIFEKMAEAGITHLDLSHNEFEKFPKQLFNIKSLEYLDMSYNNLRYIPVEITDLVNLKVLILRGNGISAYPEFLRRAPNLVVIDLRDNYMVAPVRPNCVVPMRKPKVVEVGDAMDTTPDEPDPHAVPFKCRGSLDVLTCGKIKVHMNMLIVPNLRYTEIPWLNNVESVESLYLSNNRLSEIPEKVRSYTGLRRLYLTNNNLTHLPKWIGELKNLEMLFIEARGTDILADEFGMSPELRCLITSEDGAFFKTQDMLKVLETYLEVLPTVSHRALIPDEPEISKTTHALISKSLKPYPMKQLLNRIPVLMSSLDKMTQYREELEQIAEAQTVYEDKERFKREFTSEYVIFD